MDRGIWKSVKEGLFVPTHNVNGVVVNKSEKDWTKDDKEYVQHGLKEKFDIIIALGLDDFFIVFQCVAAKCESSLKLPMKELIR